MLNTVNKLLKCCTVLLAAAALNATMAHAMPIPVGLAITGEIGYDDTFGFADAGDFYVTEGGTTSSSTYADGVVTGDNPQPATLTQTGDGLGFNGTGSATDDAFATGIDAILSAINNHASDIYEITFRLVFNNSANADGPNADESDTSFDDAFADSEITLFDDGGEIAFSDLVSDTLFGDEVGGALTGTFGADLSESDADLGAGNNLFTYVLNPGEEVNFDLLWTMEGEDFAGGLAEGGASAFLSVDSVTITNNPPTPTIPLPGTSLLLGLGIVILRLIRHRR